MSTVPPAPVPAGPWVLSIAVLAAIALVLGAIRAMRQPGDRRRGVLMVVAAAVLLVNVCIAAWP